MSDPARQIGSDKNVRDRLSVPRAGVALTSVTEERARHVRRAVREVEDSLARADCEGAFFQLFGPRWEYGEIVSDGEPVHRRAAWGMVGIWLLGRATGILDARASLSDAEEWFCGTARSMLPPLASLINSGIDRRVCATLNQLAFDEALVDLLPYILDPHGPGSRLSVMRDPLTAIARSNKRRNGVFYTPADVAEYMAAEAFCAHDAIPQKLRCLDPACGSGVFLRALLSVASAQSQVEPYDRYGHAKHGLFGLDISPLSIEMACFVVLHDSMPDALAGGLAPWAAWHRIRLNFSAIDSTLVLPPRSDTCQATVLEARMALIEQLERGQFVGQSAFHGHERSAGHAGTLFSSHPWGHPLDRLFPEVAEGFDLLIGNPPYSALSPRDDAFRLSEEYDTIGQTVTGRENLYPLFVEMMWRLTRPGRCSGAVVVPLSLAYHSGKQFSACRRVLSRRGARLRFSFFDREPHALFGEDVKTRNTIILRRESGGDPPRGEAALVETGPMTRCTSRTREDLFDNITFTPLGNANIARGIPKLHGSIQSSAAAKLSEGDECLADCWLNLESCKPAWAFERSNVPRVFVASTAYNFLNVFRPHVRRPELACPLTENPLIAMTFASEQRAWRCLAILSSRLVYWWWHVWGDGFHVPRRFLERIPFSDRSFTPFQLGQLRQLGEKLWQSLKSHQIVSLNGGRASVAYRPHACVDERDDIDTLLIQAAGLELRFSEELRSFVYRTVVVDETDERRRALL